MSSDVVIAKPVVSVLMPIYNCERYLRQSLDSLARQTLTKFEVILVNDGSTDQSGKIAEDFASRDARFRIVNQANQGIVAALNNGLLIAKGHYIARLDGDDLAHPERLQLQVDYLNNNPSCACVGSLYRAIDENGSLKWVQKVFTHLRQTNLSVFPPHVATLPHPSIMLRTKTMRGVNGYRHQFPHAEDYDLFLRLAQLGTLDIIPKHLLDYRVHSASLSSRNLETQVDSALMAVMSAIIHQQGGEDPATGRSTVTLEEFYKLLTGSRTKKLFVRCRELRRVGAWMNRGDITTSKENANGLLKTLMSDFLSLAWDLRYWSLVTAVFRLRLKILLRRI
jgi:glycosyltransferase involved in cell wall biosynthesis